MMAKQDNLRNSVLEAACQLYSRYLGTKEEAFLAGYMMALGEELNQIESALFHAQMVKKELKKWAPLIALINKAQKIAWLTLLEEEFKIKRDICKKSLDEAKEKLRKALQKRGVQLPDWLNP